MFKSNVFRSRCFNGDFQLTKLLAYHTGVYSSHCKNVQYRPEVAQRQFLPADYAGRDETFNFQIGCVAKKKLLDGTSRTTLKLFLQLYQDPFTQAKMPLTLTMAAHPLAICI